MHVYRIAWIVLIAATCCLAADPPTADFFVSPAGNDRWSGTLAEPNAAKTDGPFATLQRARDAMRKRSSAGGTVLIRGGLYLLKDAFALDARDSGAADRPTIYAAYPGEQPVLSGGMRIEGPWRATETPGVVAVTLPKGLWVQDLFLDGRRLPRSRMPDAGAFHARPVGSSKTVFGYEPGDLAAWPDADSGVVVILPYEWCDFHLPVASIDEKARTVTLAKPCGYALVPGGFGAPAEYHVENVLAAIDRPGEWCHNRKTGVLSLRPPEGVDLAKADVLAGRLPFLFSLDGQFPKGQWVEHVELRGLTFRHTARDARWRHFETTAVRLQHGVRDCRVIDCRFEDLGGSGVVIWKECQRNTVAGCQFVRCGDDPVHIFDYLGEGPPAGSGNRIVDNWIHHCGVVRRSISGISISGSENNVIAHNLIHDLPYNGITLSGTRMVYWNAKNAPELAPPYTAAKIKPYIRSRGNVVEFNHIHHVMQSLFDGGGIYFWGTMGEGPNLIRNNLIHHVGVGKRTAVGIYLDDSCDDVQVTDNVVYAVNMGLHLHGAPRDRVENNVFACCGRTDISIQPEEYNIRPMSTVVRHNIFAFGLGQVFSTGEGWNKSWDRRPIGEMDFNLYWREGRSVALGQGNLKGFDAHSAVADPQFAAAKPGDFVLRPGPAAEKLGIKPVDLSQVGLTRPPAGMAELPPREPVHFPLSDAALRGLPGWQPFRSKARAFLTDKPPAIDGRLAAGEWPTLGSADQLILVQLADKGGDGRRPSFAAVMVDAKNLYVALRNPVADAKSLRREGGAWGKDDGAEVCLQAAGGDGSAGPIFVLRGFPSGAFASSTEAGAPAAAAERLGAACRFAAAVGEGEWTAEYAIPWAAAGVSPDGVQPLRFNIGVFKKADVQWIAWVGTGRENWAVADAGLLQRRPAVRADSANLLTNADFEAGDKRPAAWNTIWWDTSREPREADREPKCTWPAEGRLGDRCLKIASADAAKMATRQGGFVQDIPSPGPGRCVLGFDLRAAKLAMADAAAGGSFSAYVHVVRKDGSHGANVGQDASTVPGGGFDWTRVEIPIDAPEDAATLAVIFQFQRMTGEVWVDNVTFRRCAGR